jgi:hypothetical protein
MNKTMDQVIKQTRRHKRTHFSVPIIFAYHYNNKIVVSYGMSFNLSKAGMCFYTNKPLHDGLKLHIHSCHIWDNPKSSTVRWCSKKDPHYYKVGISFQEKDWIEELPDSSAP